MDLSRCLSSFAHAVQLTLVSSLCFLFAFLGVCRILWMRSLWRVQTQIRVVNAFRGTVDKRPAANVLALGSVEVDPEAHTHVKRESSAGTARSSLAASNTTAGRQLSSPSTAADGFETDV